MSAERPALRRDAIAGIDLLLREGAPEHTIFLLHGIGGRAASFAPLMRQWPTGPRLIAWDAPGYGRSLSLRQEWPLPEDYAERLMDLVAKVRLRNVRILGQSLGALIAAACASWQKIDHLVLMSPALGYGVPRGGPLTEALAKRCTDFEREGAAAFAASRAQRLVNDPPRKPGITDAVQTAMATLSNPGHTQAIRMLASGNLLAAAAKIACPVLLINGAQDLVTPVDGTRRVLTALQARPRGTRIDERLDVIEDAGHAVYLEQTAAVAAAASPFFGGAV